MKLSLKPLVVAVLAGHATTTFTQSTTPEAQLAQTETYVKKLGTVTITGNQPTSLPTQIPTTIEGITGKEIAEKINAFDAEDALKYFPSLLVRKRYVGDFDHAVLATRASGTGNSARSLVYADGILLSNLLGNGASYTPRWGLVSPEEIERVDVLYGPFSAAYPGNSVGAVVDYVTRMPKAFEAQVKSSYFLQNYKQYGTNETYNGYALSASLGSRTGAWSWWLAASRLDNAGHPIAFANKLVTLSTVGIAGTRVSGAVADKNPKNQDWLILGDTNQIDTAQNQAKAKIAYDFSSTVRASYTLGYWKNDADRFSNSYLKDASGNAIYGGNVNIDGRQYSVADTDFSRSTQRLEHVIHGLTIKSNSRGVFDWELAGSLYDYSKDISRSALGAYPTTSAGGTGRVTDLKGTGWSTLSARGVWRPGTTESAIGNHVVEFGYQDYASKLRTLVSDTSDWRGAPAGARFSAFNGNTDLQGLFAQETWTISPQWRATAGLRWERWHAFGGEIGNATSIQKLSARNESYGSSKLAIAYQATPDWTIKGSVGRAMRTPTVAELYQGSISATSIVNNDPNLKAEKSWTSELTAERQFA